MNKNQSKFWILFKYFLTIDFYAFLPLIPSKHKGNRGKKAQGIAIIIALLYLGVLFVPRAIDTLVALWDSPAIKVVIFGMSVGIFVIMFLNMLSQSYSFIEKSEESEMLLSLPLNGKDIIMARVLSLGTSFIIMMGSGLMLIVTLTKLRLYQSIIEIIFGNLSIILLMLESILLSGIVVMLIGKLIKNSKLFNRFSKVLYAIMFMFFLGLYIVFVVNMSSGDPSTSAQDLMIVDSVVKYTQHISAPFFWLSWSSELLVAININEALLPLVIGLVSCIILYVGFDILSAKNYLEILRSSNTAVKDTHKTIAKRKIKGLTSKRNGHFKLIFIKELKNIFSNPTYILQIFPSDIMAIVFGTIIIQKINSSGTDLSAVIAQFLASFSQLEITVIFLGVGCVLGLFAGLGSIVMSSVSREGKAFWIMANAPIKTSTQIFARIFACQISHLFTYTLLIIGTAIFIYRFDFIYYLCVFLGLVIMLIASASISMVFGLIKPSFDWKTPKEAVNNGSGGIYIFLSIIVNYALYGLCIAIALLGAKYHSPIISIITVDIAIVIIVAAISLYVDFRLYNRVIKNM